jgi:hypothetical protein
VWRRRVRDGGWERDGSAALPTSSSLRIGARPYLLQNLQNRSDILTAPRSSTLPQATAETRVPVALNLEFANDSLYCEWAYVVDLDGEAFEVFAGAEWKDKTSSKRFNEIGERRDTVPDLVKSFSFTELPTTKAEFIGILNRALEGI